MIPSKSVKLPGGKSFSIDASAVHQILGIPLGGKKVPTKSSSHAKSIVLKDTSGSRQATKIDDLIATVNQLRKRTAICATPTPTP